MSVGSWLTHVMDYSTLTSYSLNDAWIHRRCGCVLRLQKSIGLPCLSLKTLSFQQH